MSKSFIHFAICALSASTAFAGIGVYVSPPDVQTSIDSAITGTVTEDFNARAPEAFTGYFSATTDITYTVTAGTVQFIDNNLYGGYQQGEYLGITRNSSLTLTLGTAVQYFGFYFTASDAQNDIKIYSGNTLLLDFSAASLLSVFPQNSTVTAINGSVYQTNNYYGQPTTNSNPNEVYAYLHFIATAGTTFDKIVLSQGNTGAIFENDNHSLLTMAPSIPGTLVLVPEPSTFAMFGLGGVVFAALAGKRRRVQF